MSKFTGCLLLLFADDQCPAALELARSVLGVVTVKHRLDLAVGERVDEGDWYLKPLEGSVAARLCSEKQN